MGLVSHHSHRFCRLSWEGIIKGMLTREWEFEGVILEFCLPYFPVYVSKSH